MTEQQLCDLAIQAMQNAYAPYSGYTVGAALLTDDRRVFSGCNIENSAFSPTVCAERTAFFKAISEGCCTFRAVAIAGGRDGNVTGACPPCGVCRQVMAEFCDPSFRVLLVTGEHTFTSYTLGELLPAAFHLDD